MLPAAPQPAVVIDPPGPVSAEAVALTLVAGPRTTIWNASNSLRAALIDALVPVGTTASSARTLCIASVTVTPTAEAALATINVINAARRDMRVSFSVDRGP